MKCYRISLHSNIILTCISMAQQLLVGQGILNVKASQSRSDTPQSVRLYKWSVRLRDLYLTKYNIHDRPTSTPPAGFESPIPASQRPRTHALDRVATGIGLTSYCLSDSGDLILLTAFFVLLRSSAVPPRQLLWHTYCWDSAVSTVTRRGIAEVFNLRRIQDSHLQTST
jgi:hypothetical protein